MLADSKPGILTLQKQRRRGRITPSAPFFCPEMKEK